MLSGLTQAYTGMADSLTGAAGLSPTGVNEQQAIQNEQKAMKAKQSQEIMLNAQKNIEGEVLSKRLLQTARNLEATGIPEALQKAAELRNQAYEIKLKEQKLKLEQDKFKLDQKSQTDDSSLAVDALNWRKSHDTLVYNLDVTTEETKQNNKVREIYDIQQEKILKQTSKDARIIGTIKTIAASDLSQGQKDYLKIAVSNKTITPEQAWEILKPPTPKEAAELAKTIAATVKLDSDSASSSSVKPAQRASFFSALLDNGQEVPTQVFKDFMANGDAAALTKGATLKDNKAEQLLAIVDQNVGLLDDKAKQEFLALRTDLVNKDLPLKERIDQESQFLNKQRDLKNTREYNVKFSNFKHVEKNLTGLQKRLEGILTDTVDEETGKIKESEFKPHRYMLTEVFSSNLHLAGSPEREVYNINQTLKSNSVLETMAELKRLSPTGSTGFGSTNAYEVGLLESDIAALDPSDKNYLKDTAWVVERLILLSRQGVGELDNISGETVTPSSPRKYKVIQVNN
tara:strand:- start:680 stop:2224 length:1545 start_codon:yes stop_codon:yes gene_type:complete